MEDCGVKPPVQKYSKFGTLWCSVEYCPSIRALIDIGCVIVYAVGHVCIEWHSVKSWCLIGCISSILNLLSVIQKYDRWIAIILSRRLNNLTKSCVVIECYIGGFKILINYWKSSISTDYCIVIHSDNNISDICMSWIIQYTLGCVGRVSSSNEARLIIYWYSGVGSNLCWINEVYWSVACSKNTCIICCTISYIKVVSCSDLAQRVLICKGSIDTRWSGV